jgi:hypothetical protein
VENSFSKRSYAPGARALWGFLLHIASQNFAEAPSFEIAPCAVIDALTGNGGFLIQRLESFLKR